jgi:hypothetical protein
MEGREVGDTIRGSKIVAEARKVTDPIVIVKTGLHKAQRVIFIRERHGQFPLS